MRLFVAVALPEPTMALVDALPKPERSGVRWTTAAQWHITLRFLGEAPPEPVIASLRAALASSTMAGGIPASMGPATAWFPGRRILQIPVTGLDELGGFVRQATAAWGPEDEPPFAGHLTLARTSGRARGPADLAGSPLSATFAVSEFALYSSLTAQTGAVYNRIARFRLAVPRDPDPSPASAPATLTRGAPEPLSSSVERPTTE